MNAQEKIAEEQRKRAEEQQAIANQQIGKTDVQQGLANEQVLRAGNQVDTAGNRISVADQQKQQIQDTGNKLMDEAGGRAAEAGQQATDAGTRREATADYLGNITHPMAEGKGGYSADEASAIQDKSGLAVLGDKAASIGPSQDYLNSQQMTPQQQQDLITKAGISAGAGASAAKEAIQRQAGASGGNPLALAAFRARLDRQSAGEQGDAMTNARIAASNAAATRAAGAEQQRESGLASSTAAGLNVSNAGSTRAQTVGDTRLAQQTQGLNAEQTQNSQANADEQAARSRQQTSDAQKAGVYGVQSGNTNQAVGLGNQAVGLGTEAVNAGTGAVNAGTGAVNAGTNASEAGTQAVNAGTNAANTGLAASQKPGVLDKVIGAASGALGALKLADGDYLGSGTDAIVGEQGPEKVVDASSLSGGGFRARAKASPPIVNTPAPAYQQPDTEQRPGFRASRQQQPPQMESNGAYPQMADAGFLGKIGTSIKNAVTGTSPTHSMPEEGDYGQSTQDDTATAGASAPQGIPFWQRLKSAAKDQQPQDQKHQWSPVDTYSGIGKMAGTLGKAFMAADGKAPDNFRRSSVPVGPPTYAQKYISDNEKEMARNSESARSPWNALQEQKASQERMQKQAEAAMAERHRLMNLQPPSAYADGKMGNPAYCADGKMGIPHTKFAGNAGIFTTPTQVKLLPNEAVVPLSFRAKAKVRPSMAALPAAIVKPRFFGSMPATGADKLLAMRGSGVPRA